MLVAGLGNPGKEYVSTRHNVGFMAIDEIVRKYNFSEPKKKYKAEFYEGIIDGEKIFALKPQTFMNKSGISLAEIVNFYKIPPEDIVVIHDELDFPVGKIRMKTGGGAGGHNGLRSIDSFIGKDYRRLRIGIDHPGDKNKVHSYVLKKFPKDDQIKIDIITSAIADNLPMLIKGEDEKFMTKVALILNPPQEKKPKPKEIEEKNGI